MKLITDFLNHPILYGLLSVMGLAVFLVLVGLVLLPFHWLTDKLDETRCPKCRDLFKRKLVDWKFASEKEVLKTVNRVDQGTIYSNNILEPNHAIEIHRQEQVTMVERVHLNHWVCKNPDCGHQWQTEEVSEYEGSLEKLTGRKSKKTNPH